jgi:hypothetical protein
MDVMRIREIDPASGTFEEKAMRGAMGETPLRVIRRRLSALIGAIGAGTRLAVTLIFHHNRSSAAGSAQGIQPFSFGRPSLFPLSTTVDAAD